MAGEWRKARLGEVVRINPDALGSDWPFSYIKYVDISSVGEGSIVEPPRILRLDEAPSRAKRLVREGDTVLSTVRPGRRSMFFVKEPEPEWVVSTGFAVLRPCREYIEPRYLYACVFDRGLTEFLIKREKGAAYPAVLPEDIADAIIKLPPLPEQRAIAHILGTLDDKIELNRRMSETLEQMAQALFKAWFVDFDPVRAKCRGGFETRPYTDLFPDRLMDSELGKIPEGWDVVTLPKLVEINPGRPLRKGEIAPYLDMANMPTRGHAPDQVAHRPFTSGTRFINGDTLVARITPCLENGKTAFVDFLEEGQVGWGSTEYIVLHPKPPLPEEFGYCLARSDAFREFAIQSMTGTSGRQRVQADSIGHFKLPRPPDSVAVAFGRLVKPLFARSSDAVRESRTLAALRDALLTKLISGELRVKDAEKFLRECGL
ncbi:restriction endonuclease subunit S [Chloroflexus aggregans]|uniref:Restriction modification system DNA specificity subunit n=1 Tax=Chloroflexus aggregans (strain MD-66 / DSM 9485) TaxID=326427 RepID=B8G892_CHLAD|nr:restriction endonuclease subunit S [Chloroflexus aggregans]ACL26146.1 restriction modification system DNA specificity subunit [Chloroflexus aggregans DSM 9485]